MSSVQVSSMSKPFFPGLIILSNSRLECFFLGFPRVSFHRICNSTHFYEALCERGFRGFGDSFRLLIRKGSLLNCAALLSSKIKFT